MRNSIIILLSLCLNFGVEYVNFGLNGQNKYLKLEETSITFFDNAQYNIELDN